MCVLLITQLLRLVGKLEFNRLFNHTSLKAVVTPTSPQSVHNRCVIKLLVAFFCQFEFWNFLWVKEFLALLGKIFYF